MQSNPSQVADLSAMQELIERDLLRFAFEDSTSEIYVIDAHTLRFVAVNKVARFAVGLDMRDLQQLRAGDLITGLSAGRIERFMGQVQKRQRPLHCTLTTQKSPRTLHECTIHYRDGPKPSLVIYAKDGKGIQDAVQMAHQAEDRLTTAIEALSDGFVLYDADDRLVVCNEMYRSFYPQSAAAMVRGAKFEDILRFGLEHDQYELDTLTSEAWLAKRLTDHRQCNPVAEQRLSDGRWLRIVERPTADGGRVGLRVDVTHLKQQQDELRRLSRTDDLTGLLNRRGLSSRLTVLAAGLSETTKIQILHIDLDRFKDTNDMLGHAAGDALLRHVSDILRNCEPKPDGIARVGGDEFILIRRIENADTDVENYAQRIIERLRVPLMIDDQSCDIGASIGVSFVTMETALGLDDPLTAADIALNAAKQNGGNCAVLFEPEMREATLRQIEMAKEIQRGLSKGEFSPHFQPQVDTATGKVVGFEALVRWLHPEKGWIPAHQFLSVAQRAGMTAAIDNLVLEKTCLAIRELKSWGFEDPCISINMSMDQVNDPHIVSKLKTTMNRIGVTPQNIRIELLESTLLDDRTNQIVRNVNALIKAGFEVELDDFGTGHAAIATLRKFAVSRIKVDRSFVADIDKDPQLQMITAVLLDLALNLGISALAEGVETQGEQETLNGLGCHVAQGYLHARPMPLDKIKDWLQERGDID